MANGAHTSGRHYTDDDTIHNGSLGDGQSDNSTEMTPHLPSQGLTAEQSEHLLGGSRHENLIDDDEGGDNLHVKEYGDLSDVRPRPRREAWWRTCIFLCAVLASTLSLLLLVKIAFFDGAAVRPEQTEQTEHAEYTELAMTSVVPVPEVVATTAPTPATTTEPVGYEATETPSFRRPESDYVLDRNWDYNAPPTVREYNWVVQNIEANPDGIFRTMITINGQFPGELIRCNEGDTIVVNVENKAANATAIHWHGLFQNGTNHMDGTPGATQCPIAPGRSFRYEFTVRGQSGTYFYHGHQGAESLDGLIGPMVIHSRDERKNQVLPYDTDRVVLVQDWYHDLSSGLLKEALAPGSESPPLPNGALVNGANVVNCDAYPDRRCDNSTGARVPALDLEAGASHRLRFINIGGFAWFEVSLDRHLSLPVTEVDGVDVAPVLEKTLLIAPGQRYSVVLTTNETSTPDRAYWLRARIATHCFSEYTLAGKDNPQALAIVRYTDIGDSRHKQQQLDPARIPTTNSDSGDYIVLCQDMNTRKPPNVYHPVPAVPAPAYADHSYYIRLNIEIHDHQLQRGYLNESSYRPNLLSPALHRAVDGLHEGNTSYIGADGAGTLAAFDTRSELVLAHKDVKVIDLIIQNFDEGSHPLHLHGHEMFVLGSGHGYFPGYVALGLKPEGKGLLNPQNASVIASPVRRDVVSVEGFGWTILRVVVDNPGVWKFHCHMIWHGDGGMGMLLLSRTDVLRDIVIPEANRALCEASTAELESGGAPKDSLWSGR
ncbi:hypothetical protein HMPREF1624_06111 [Sporothrix schenckii ATCC 58251]|uniref:L-ascorbate oxidase n=1 Tax=Sporothrix schenckii (strain ATCC 58251 / de Perez 2211183) TaxID=1391915 RepID=U7PTZ6_SPOS1|nr:hypothetical protein HMPREF1624_06111 [Sporothrix schenckii ATCC 58251]